MDNVINRIIDYSKKINLEERFDYKFNLDESIFDQSTIKSINDIPSNFQKNVHLKKLLQQQYHNHSENTPLDFWIINQWGGIHGFKPHQRNIDKISKFKSQLEKNKLTKENFETISSLSKISSFLNPREYFVYDARVAYALNWLILKYENNHEVKLKYFPVPNSRNKALVNYDIKTILNIVHSDKRQNQDIYHKPQEAYHYYCDFIKQASKNIYGNTENPFLVEMLLFVIADKEILEDIQKIKMIL